MTPDQTRRLRAKAMLANSHAIGARKGGLIRAMRAAIASSEQDRKPPTLPRVLWLERPDP
jgi:hypothetical protein